VKKEITIKLSVSGPEINQSYTHVITASAHSAGHVRAKADVHEGLAYLNVFYFALHIHVHEVAHLLVGVALPDAVTAHQDEIYLRK